MMETHRACQPMLVCILVHLDINVWETLLNQTVKVLHFPKTKIYNFPLTSSAVYRPIVCGKWDFLQNNATRWHSAFDAQKINLKKLNSNVSFHK